MKRIAPTPARRRLPPLALLVAVLAWVSGCADSPAAASAVVAAAPCGGPVVITIQRDISRSTATNGIPEVNIDHVKSLAHGVVGVCGGELMYGEIGAQLRPLIRLVVTEPPSQPTLGPLPRNAYKEGRQRADYQRKMTAWSAQQQAWEDARASEIETFMDKVAPLLARPGRDTSTDLEGAVARSFLAISEERPGWSKPSRKIALVVTDGIGTTRRPEASVPGDVTVVVAGQAGALTRLGPKVFEDTGAAVRYIASLSFKEQDAEEVR